MHDESISQAEIDALVRGMSDDSPASGQAGRGGGQDDSALLREALRAYTSQAGRALSDLVGAACQAQLAEVAATSVAAMGALMSGQLLVGRSAVSGGLNGPVYYLLPVSLGQALITQIYGGVAPSTLDDSALGALSDGLMQMNQVLMSRIADDLLGQAILPASLEVIEAASLADSGGVNPETAVYAAGIDLTAGADAGRIYLVLPQEVAAPLIKAVREKRSRKSADAPTPNPAITAGIGAVFAAAHPVPPAAHEVAVAAPPVAYQPASFPAIAPRGGRDEIRNIDLLLDVNLQVTVGLGRTRKQIREVLSLGPGSVLELDKLAGEQVDVLVNGKLIAKGEVVVIDENYGVRISDIISPVERVQSLK